MQSLSYRFLFQKLIYFFIFVFQFVTVTLKVIEKKLPMGNQKYLNFLCPSLIHILITLGYGGKKIGCKVKRKRDH